MKLLRTFNPRYKEYLDYLDEHIGGVIQSWEDVLRPAIESSGDEELLDMLSLDEIGLQVYNHDNSKYQEDEFTAYCNHWYPQDGSDVDHKAASSHKSEDMDYAYAWNHHQHNNKHHSQYWLCVEDDGTVYALDMPVPYICEMLCDWHSFSRLPDNQTAYEWWQDNRDKFIMSDNTVEWVEKLIQYMVIPLYIL